MATGDDNGIVWEDPPSLTRGGPGTRIWLDRLEPLMAHPHRWARVSKHPTASTAGSTVSNLKSGRLVIPDGQWEFVGRTVDGGAAVYARYLGPKEPA